MRLCERLDACSTLRVIDLNLANFRPTRGRIGAASTCPMDRQPVTSHVIASIGYDAETQTLEIEFRERNRVHQYLGVSDFIYRGLVLAPSKTTFFARTIQGRYEERDVTPAVVPRTTVICPSCNEPTATLEGATLQTVSLRCPACGHQWQTIAMGAP